MFTGLIKELSVVRGFTPSGSVYRLEAGSSLIISKQ